MEPNCPKCGGAMWNNIATKRKPTQPDFRCKDRNCDGVIWPPRNAPAVSNGNGAPASTAPTATARRPLGPVYNECLEFAKKACVHHFGNDASVTDIIAATATLFIQAVKDNAPIRTLAAAPVAPPPPPAAPAPAYAQSTPEQLPF